MNDISVDPPTNLKLRTTKWFTTGKESKKTILEDSDGNVSALIISSNTHTIFFLISGHCRENCHRQIDHAQILICSCVKYFLQNILDVVFRKKKVLSLFQTYVCHFLCFFIIRTIKNN